MSDFVDDFLEDDTFDLEKEQKELEAAVEQPEEDIDSLVDEFAADAPMEEVEEESGFPSLMEIAKKGLDSPLAYGIPVYGQMKMAEDIRNWDEEDTQTAEDATRGAVQGVTFGTGDEMAGGS